MDESFELLRGERRSFFCPNKLWVELKEQTKGYCSVSQYVKMAIVEKMIKDEPGKKDYYEQLLFNK